MTAVKPPNQNELLYTFAQFTNEERMKRTFAPKKLPPAKNTELQKDKFEKKYGLIITGAAVTTGAGIFLALYRGGRLFNLKKFIKKLTHNNILKKIQKVVQSENVSQAKTKTTLYANTFWEKIQNTCNLMANTNPLKDIGVAELTRRSGVQPVFDKITKFFTAQGKKLARKKYDEPIKNLGVFRQNILKAINEIAEKKPEGAEVLVKELQKVLDVTDKQMLSIAGNFDKRFDKTVEILNTNAKRRFLDVFRDANGKFSFKTIKQNAKKFGDFIPEKIMQEDKNKIYEELMKSKKILSNNVLDLEKTVSDKLDDIFFNTSLEKPEIRKTYANLKELLENFKNPKKSSFSSRKEVKKALIESVINAKQLEGLDSAKIGALDDLAQYIRNDKKGAIEEAVSKCLVLKKINPKLYQTLFENRNAVQRSLNKAIEFETEKTYGRLLDFALDAVPSDILGQLAGLGGIAWIMADRKKTKEQKISANLKSGIPLLGGLAVSALCNLRQVASGVNAILLGVITGFILNRIGSVADKKYQFHMLAKKQQTTDYFKSQASS